MYSKIQLFFLSFRALEHFENFTDDFVIDDLLEPNGFYEDLVDSFNQLDSLFHSKTQILLTTQNLPVFNILADLLENPSLKSQCKKVLLNQNQIFKLTSKHLRYILQNQKFKLTDFNLIVNDKLFSINFELFCCASNKLVQTDFHSSDFVCQIPEYHFECFRKFIDLFIGYPASTQDSSFCSWMFLIDYFDLMNLLPTFSKIHLYPHSFDESVEFLSQSYCSKFEHQYNQSISFLINNLENISREQFRVLPNFVLIDLFSSKDFKIQNEDELLSFIFELISTNPDRKDLLQTVKFPCTLR